MPVALPNRVAGVDLPEPPEPIIAIFFIDLEQIPCAFMKCYRRMRQVGFGNETQFIKQRGFLACDLYSNRQRKCTNGDWFADVVDQIETVRIDAAAQIFRDVDVLQQPYGASLYCVMDILSFKLVNEV